MIRNGIAIVLTLALFALPSCAPDPKAIQEKVAQAESLMKEGKDTEVEKWEKAKN